MKTLIIHEMVIYDFHVFYERQKFLKDIFILQPIKTNQKFNYMKNSQDSDRRYADKVSIFFPYDNSPSPLKRGEKICLNIKIIQKG